MGSREIAHAKVPVPPLKKPGGEVVTIAGGGFIGSVERVTVKLDASKVRIPTGRATTGSSAGVFHSYQRIRVSVRNPVTTISVR